MDKIIRPEDIKILLNITTTRGSNWREKITEINDRGIKEVAIFPTALNKIERKELYRLLENSSIKKIPFVHIRSDMETDEIDYLMYRFGTKVFNIHTKREFPYPDYGSYKKFIFIENCFFPYDKEEIKLFGGVCVDMSHLENNKLEYNSIYKHNVKVIDSFIVGCNHISAIKEETWIDNDCKDFPNMIRHDFHQMGDLCEFDYLKNYSTNFLSPYIAIELENTIEEQLKAKSYLEKIIKDILEEKPLVAKSVI